MRSRNVFRRFRWPAIIIGVCLVGCAHSPIPEYYRLVPESRIASGMTVSNAQIIAAAVTLPDYVKRPEIVVRRQGNIVDVDEFNRWAGNLEDNITVVLNAEFSHRAQRPESALRDAGKIMSGDQILVEIEFTQLEVSLTDEVVIEGHCRYLLANTRASLMEEVFRLQSDPGSRTVAEAVSALNKLIITLAIEILHSNIRNFLAER